MIVRIEGSTLSPTLFLSAFQQVEVIRKAITDIHRDVAETDRLHNKLLSSAQPEQGKWSPCNLSPFPHCTDPVDPIQVQTHSNVTYPSTSDIRRWEC